MKSNIARLLNLRPNETSLVFRLMGVQFLMGLGIAFLITSSYTFFLVNYAVPELPWVYIATAILLFPVNGLYARLDQRFNSFRLMQMVLIFSAISVGLFLAAWFFLPSFTTAVLLVAWNIVVYMLIGYGFWGMASLLFDVRESRRVFSVIGAGDLPAKLLGYLAISILAKKLPVEVLMGASVGFFLLASLVARYSLGSRRIDWDRFEQAQHHVAHQAISNWWSRFFGSRLIMAIAALSFVAYLVFFIMDFTFMSEIKVRNKSASELTAFLAMFFGVGRVLAIIFKLIFSSRFLSRMGLMTTLLFTPMILAVVASVIWVTSTVIQDNTLHFLYLFGIMSLLSEVLRSAVQEPVFFVLFQPLEIHLRLKGHLIAKGYVLPPALFIVGFVLLWWLSGHPGMDIALTIGFVLVLLLVWMALVPWIKKAYFQTVTKSIGKGIFSGAALFLTDEAVETSLVNKVNNGQPLQVVHALDLLERSEYPRYEALLFQQLKHPNSTVRKFVLQQIAQKRWKQALPALEMMQKEGLDKGVEKEFLKTLWTLNPPVANRQPGPEAVLSSEMQQVMLEALLESHEEEGRRLLRDYSLSANPEIRLMAANAIAKTAFAEASHLVEKLVLDSDTTIKKQALAAAGILKIQSIIPLLIESLNDPLLKHNAAEALRCFGDALFESPLANPEKMSEQQVVAMVGLAGNVFGPDSTRFLVKSGQSQTLILKHVIDALWRKEAEETIVYKADMQDWIQPLLDQCEKKRQVAHNLGQYPEFAKLAQSVITELDDEITALLQLSGLIFGKIELSRTIEILHTADHANTASALELVELTLPVRLATQVCGLLEFFIDKRKGVVMLGPSAKIPVQQVLGDIFNHRKLFSSWSIGLAYYLMGKHPIPSFFSLIAQYSSSEQVMLVKEARDFMVSQLKTD